MILTALRCGYGVHGRSVCTGLFSHVINQLSVFSFSDADAVLTGNLTISSLVKHNFSTIGQLQDGIVATWLYFFTGQQ
ncbi:hypothetical protein D3C87_1572710 [compost metagenome]